MRPYAEEKLDIREPVKRAILFNHFCSRVLVSERASVCESATQIACLLHIDFIDEDLIGGSTMSGPPVR